MFIDLHTHTTCSDGTLTPKMLVHRARDLSLQAVAITDHDTVAGNQEAVQEGINMRCEVIPGVELSATSEGTLHILGLYVDSQNSRLLEATSFLQKNRKDRNIRMLHLLEELGISMDKKPFLENAYMGRPHMGQTLVDSGVVPTMDAAFERYLKKGAPAYVERVKLSPRKTLQVIFQAGGVSVLAHPITLPHPEAVIKLLLPHGLLGIEVFYPTHSTEDTRYFLELAEKYGLLVTGGSDFHGEHKPHIDLGCMHVPASLLGPVKKAHQKILEEK
jgi:hypothetical protein